MLQCCTAPPLSIWRCFYPKLQKYYGLSEQRSKFANQCGPYKFTWPKPDSETLTLPSGQQPPADRLRSARPLSILLLEEAVVIVGSVPLRLCRLTAIACVTVALLVCICVRA